MTYKIFELVPVHTIENEMSSFALKDINEVYETEQECIDRIASIKTYSWSDYIILKTY